jgi:hypothetical protein
MSEKTNENGLRREYNKNELIEKINLAEKSLCVIGATIFDLPWKEILEKSLTEKFFGQSSDFQIRILRESENTIAQYALLSQNKSNEGSGGFSRGNLNGVKENVVKVLKNELKEYAQEHITNYKGAGIEPPEDIYNEELTQITDAIIRKKMLAIIEEEGQFDYLLPKIKDIISKCLSNEFSIHWEQISKESGHGRMLIERLLELQRDIDEISDKIANSFSSVKALGDLNIASVLKGLGDEKCKDGEIKFPIKKNPDPKEKSDWITIGKSLKAKIQETITSFKTESDSNIDFKLNSAREHAEKLASEEEKRERAAYSESKEKAQRLFIKDSYMPIPVPLIKIDDEIFITHALTKFDTVEKFQYVGNIDSPAWKKEENKPYRSYWITEFQNYYNTYFSDPAGVQKYSTEETSKGDREEVIDIFNEARVRIGTGPRDAFLSNMAIVKLVVWALIFDRKGNLLIHQRAINAKDNRGLWDKSVGGHVSVEDLDTIEAIRREIAEELYSLEYEGQSKPDKEEWLITNQNKIIYLGDWKTGRYPDFRGLNLNSDEYYAFSLNYSGINKKNFRMEVVLTERILPGGKTVKAKCFVDPYLCIVADDFDITKLQNSKYAMLTPNELKICVLSNKIKLNKDTRYYDSRANSVDFKVTSDLAYLVNSSIWDDVVTEFSKRIQDCFKEE